MKPLIKYILILSGFLSLAVGIIGVFLPILPTTPFILLSAVCFAHSSPQIYEKLINTKFIGKIIRDYKEGRGMATSAVAISISFLWVMMGISILFATKTLWLKLLLVGIGIGVSVHIFSLKNKK